MNKLKMDLEALLVESFTTAEWRGAGTVKGHSGGVLCVEGNQSWDGGCGGAGAPTQEGTCAPRESCQTCADNGTCWISCYRTCPGGGGATCGNSCPQGCTDFCSGTSECGSAPCYCM